MNLSRPFRIIRSLRKNRIPGQLVIQFTDACNARCPQCGMRVTETFSRSRIPINDIRRIIDAAARKGIEAISFTGGEPLLFFDDLLNMIRHAGAAGIPWIRTGTNGFIFSGSNKSGFRDRIRNIAERLAATPIRNFWISID
ncbi:MAG: radical SAM protein, partial [Desulfatirhabdiaceae bacterium]